MKYLILVGLALGQVGCATTGQAFANAFSQAGQEQAQEPGFRRADPPKTAYCTTQNYGGTTTYVQCN